MMALDRSPESFSPQMNSTSLLLWFKLVTPGVGPVLIPTGIIWIKFTKVYKEMLHTKNLSSIPSCFREEEFEVGLLCSYVPTCDPRGGVSFDPKGIIWIKLIKVHKEMHNIKAPILPVSEKKNFEVGFPCSYVPTCDPRGWSNLDPRSIIWTNLVEVHKEMLKSKYQSSTSSSFRGEEFWRWDSLFLCSNLWPPGGSNLTPGASYEQTW